MNAWFQPHITSLGLTHDEVAKQTGVTREYITMISSGRRRPSVTVAKRLSAVVGVDWTVFFQDESNESTHNNNSA